jgi:DNA-binding transcriptional MerR regulator/predicted transcriptional regulator YdeE
MILIGELARLLGVTSRTLRHYDAIGLFPPATIDADNGYRYYRPDQIATLERIVQLRRLDVPLDAIKACIAAGTLDDGPAFAGFLRAHRQGLHAELAARSRLLDELDHFIHHIEKGPAMPTRKLLHPTLVELPAFEVIGLSVLCEDPTPIPALWQEFRARWHEITSRSRPERAYGVGVPVSSESFRYYASWGSEPGASLPEGMERLLIPAQRYARVTHVGPVSTVVETYRQIWESLEPAWQLRPSFGPQFELHDERFKGPLDPASEVDIHIPVL